jgi:hypothetical protein
MSPAHVWACGQCGARVVARVGAIARAFQAHIVDHHQKARNSRPTAGGVGCAGGMK